MVLFVGMTGSSSLSSTFIVTLVTSFISPMMVASTNEPLLMFTSSLSVGLMKIIKCSTSTTAKAATPLYTGSKATPFLVLVTLHLYWLPLSARESTGVV